METAAHFGILSLLPTFVVLVVALVTKKTFESLLAGCLVGFIVVAKTNFFTVFADTLLATMFDETIAWIVLICGLFGSLIHLLVRSGGAFAFADYLLKFVKGRRSALLVTWLLGLSIFIDDYLNALTIGTSMKRVTDKYNISREMLAYVVDSTAAPICVLIPISTWAIYLSGLLESTGVAETGGGLNAYLNIIPFMFYAWAAALVVPLVAANIIPPLFAMKKAEARAAAGQVIPPDSESIALEIDTAPTTDSPKMANFILPILLLIGSTVAFGIDAYKGILLTVGVTVVYFSVTKVMSFEAAMESVFSGFKLMIYALAIIVFSFVLKSVNDQLGLTQYIIENITPLMSKEYLPAIAFVALSFVTFATGSFWGVYAISLPIIIPLAQSLGVDIWLAIGAVVSAGAFGSHACFYGDSTILSASASGCNNMAHAVTQLPYVLISGAVAVLLYLVAGNVMA